MIHLRLFFVSACVVLFAIAADFAHSSPPRSPLDDVPGIVNVDPDSSRVLACTQVSITVDAELLDARVFDLQFAVDSARLQLLDVIPGSESTLHIMPVSMSGTTLTVDGFFHPNFTGNTNLVTFTFYVKPVTDDDTTVVRFEDGQGYSGTYDNPVAIQFSGDSAVIYIEGTPPEPPTELLITRLNYPAYDDSVLLQWHPVFHDIDGDTLINPLYVVYREHVVADPGILDSIGSTPDTFFYDTSITMNPDTGTVKNATTLSVKVRKTQP
jgi:hypothetical protein